jgi:hypothetical protein
MVGGRRRVSHWGRVSAALDNMGFGVVRDGRWFGRMVVFGDVLRCLGVAYKINDPLVEFAASIYRKVVGVRGLGVRYNSLAYRAAISIVIAAARFGRLASLDLERLFESGMVRCRGNGGRGVGLCVYRLLSDSSNVASMLGIPVSIVWNTVHRVAGDDDYRLVHLLRSLGFPVTRGGIAAARFVMELMSGSAVTVRKIAHRYGVNENTVRLNAARLADALGIRIVFCSRCGVHSVGDVCRVCGSVDKLMPYYAR